MANFYPHLRLKPTSQVNYSLYEENCAYRREELFKFRLIEGFSEYDDSSFWRRNNKFVWLIYVQWLSIYGRFFWTPVIY